MSIKAVIFDIGNVLIEWKPERFYDAEIGEARRRAMFANVDLHAMNDQIDKGGDFQQVIYDTADKFPRYRDEIRLWHDRWIELASPAIDQSVQSLRALKSNGIQVFALSNIGTETMQIAQAHYPFLNDFDRAYVSGAMGVIKPDPAIYQKVEEDCGLAPNDLLFTDDRADNIAAAAARGWQTHHFTGPGSWLDRLIAEGLIQEGQIS